MPHGAHIPPWQTAPPAVHVPPTPPAPPQQAWPTAPHVPQLPLVHVPVNPVHVLPMPMHELVPGVAPGTQQPPPVQLLPAQHASLAPPHGWQVPPVQTLPDEQVLPAQHGSPPAPQASHVIVALLQTPPVLQVPPVQHGCEGAPQAMPPLLLPLAPLLLPLPSGEASLPPDELLPDELSLPLLLPLAPLLLPVPLLLPAPLLPPVPLLLPLVASSPPSEPAPAPVVLLPPHAMTHATASPITTRIDVFMAKLPRWGPRAHVAPVTRRAGPSCPRSA